MINKVLSHTFDCDFFEFVLLVIEGVLDNKFVEGTVSCTVFEDSLFFEHYHSYQIVKLHQISSVRNCQDPDLLQVFLFVAFQNMVLYE